VGPTSNKLVAATQMLPSVSNHNSNQFKQSPSNMKPPAIPGQAGLSKGKLSNMTAHTA